MSDATAGRVLVVASAASGMGKTTVTAGLARSYGKRGLRVACMKFGPDFLDPMILARACGQPVRNLDMWMDDGASCAARLARTATNHDVVLIESMMGLYDGAPCTADLAERLALPVLLVIDARAMAQTFGAVVHGLATYRDLNVVAVVANRVASPGHARMLGDSLRDGVPLWATLTEDPGVQIPERHLGLHPAAEVEDLDARIDALAARLGDIPLPPATALPVADGRQELPPLLKGVAIGVAQDAAFSFVYPENLELLRELGARCLPVSPCVDESLPELDALYLPGGYPELHAPALSDNDRMRGAVAAFADSGRPVLAECGGLMYLCRELIDAEGRAHPMVGVIDAAVHMQPRLAGIGHYDLTLSGKTLRGHAFHHSTIDSGVEPHAYASARRFGSPEPVFVHRGVLASYVHWYFPSNPHLTASLFGAGSHLAMA